MNDAFVWESAEFARLWPFACIVECCRGGLSLGRRPGWAISAIYKWVDEQGFTHYTQELPKGATAEQLELSPEPPKERLEEAQRRRRAELEAQRKAWAPQAVFGTLAVGFVPSGMAVLPDSLSKVTLLIRREAHKKTLPPTF